MVISIIVVLILASVSVYVLTGDNGLLTKTETAVKSNNDAQEKEKVKLAATAAKLTGHGTITTDYLNNELRNIFNDNAIAVEEKSDGWLFIGNKEYIIYKNGKVEEIIEIKEENVALLPKEYQQVEYIESTGTQYIDTGIYPSSDSKVITEVSIGEGNKKSAIFGSRIRVGGQPWRKYAILCFANVNETLNSFRCDWGSVQETDIINISDKEKNKITCDKLTIALSGFKFMKGYEARGELTGLQAFGYFIVQSNVFMAMVSFAFAIKEIQLLKGRIIKIPFKYYILNMLFHLIIPVTSIINFIIFEKTDTIKFKHTFFGLIPTILYFGIYLQDMILITVNMYISIYILYFNKGFNEKRLRNIIIMISILLAFLFINKLYEILVAIPKRYNDFIRIIKK